MQIKAKFKLKEKVKIYPYLGDKYKNKPWEEFTGTTARIDDIRSYKKDAITYVITLEESYTVEVEEKRLIELTEKPTREQFEEIWAIK